MQIPPKFSIITAVLNKKNELEKTIISLSKQKYKNFEYIVIDGDSNDGTKEIIKENGSIIDRWISEKDKGIYDAWNKGIAISKGEWVAFLGAGDTYNENALEEYNAATIENPGINYISSRARMVKGEKIIEEIGEKWDWKKSRKFMNAVHVGSMHKRELFQNYGWFDINYKISGDYEFLLRAGSRLKAHFINRALVNMDCEGMSNSNILVFEETYDAKINTARRNAFMCKVEKNIAILKWIAKKILKA